MSNFFDKSKQLLIDILKDCDLRAINIESRKEFNGCVIFDISLVTEIPLADKLEKELHRLKHD